MRDRNAKLASASPAVWKAAHVEVQIHELLENGATSNSLELQPLRDKMDELRPQFWRAEEHLAIQSIGKSLAMRRLLCREQGTHCEEYDELVQQRRELNAAIRDQRVDSEFVRAISETVVNGKLALSATTPEPTFAEAA